MLWLTGKPPMTLSVLRCARREPDGHRFRAVVSEHDVDEAQLANVFSKDLAQNVLQDGVWGRMHSTRYDLPSPPQGTRQWAQVRRELGEIQVEWRALRPPTEEEVDVRPDVIGLNFLDIMVASGRLQGDRLLQPNYIARGVRGFGSEYVGRLADGARVVGISPGAFATHLNAPRALVFKAIPDAWSDEEAVTVPVAYGTVYYTFDMRVRLRPGASVLVHSGAGGLGLATLQVLLARGHEVFTTCGTKAKREWLKRRFPELDDAHIGYSRGPGFEAMVMKGTKGRGVDAVLNSLAGSLAEEGLRCVAPYGWFIEVGKYDIMSGGSLAMAPLLRNVTVAAVDLSLALDDPERSEEIWTRVAKGISSGEVVPLPVTTFDADELGHAIQVMSRGHHIGKLVVRAEHDPAQKFPTLFWGDARTTWLVTGGLGGVGLEICAWLARRGVSRLVVSSRRGVRTGRQARALTKLRADGVEVIVSTLDAVDPEQAKALVLLAASVDAPLQGVMHLPMVLDDRLLIDQDATSWRAAIAPKATAARHLDELTRDQKTIRFFVCFSSIAADVGNQGQSNYAFANAAMERVCSARSEAGLHSLTVRWGPIGEVGWVAENRGKLNREINRLGHQSIRSCLASLEQLMVAQTRSTVTVFVENEDLWQGDMGNSDDKNLDRGLMATILKILGLSEDQVQESDSLNDVGIDSLQSVEVQTALQRYTGQTISFAEVHRLTFTQIRELAGQQRSDEPALRSTGYKTIPMAASGPIFERALLVPIRPQRIVYLIAGFATDPSELSTGLPVIAVRWERTSTLEQLREELEQEILGLSPSVRVEIWSHSIGWVITDWLRQQSPLIAARLDRWIAISPPSPAYAVAFFEDFSLEELRKLNVDSLEQRLLKLPFFLTKHGRTPLSPRTVCHQAILVRECRHETSSVSLTSDFVVLPHGDTVALKAKSVDLREEKIVAVEGDHELVSFPLETWRTIDRSGLSPIEVSSPQRPVLLFPGQGSQHVGMGAGLFKRYPELVAQANQSLEYDIESLCLTDPKGVLNQTLYTQPALFVVNALYHHAYQDSGGLPAIAVAGHSLGEYNALVVAGALDFAAGLRLVQRRAALMNDVVGGAMAAVLGMREDRLREVLDAAGLSVVDLANFNAPGQIVISGREKDIVASEAPLTMAGARWVRLQVSGAFHSRWMEPLAEKLAEAIQSETLKGAIIPVISNVTAQPYAAFDGPPASLLAQQLFRPVRWSQTIERLEADRPAVFVELGPGSTLSRLLKPRDSQTTK